MKKILYIISVAAMLTACFKVDIHNTPHPESGKLTLTTDWSARTSGIDIPASYTVESLGATATLTGTTVEYPNLLTPGDYTLNLYNTANEITVAGTVATVATVGAGIAPQPGFQFFGSLTKTIEADTDYSETVVMQQITRQLEFDLTLSGDRIDEIKTIAASLSGVVGAWDMATNVASGTATTVTPVFTRTNSKLTAMVRLLGIAGSSQKLTVKFTYNDNTTQTKEFDYTQQLSTFNDNKTLIAKLTGDIATPKLVEYSGNIDDWTAGNGDNGEEGSAEYPFAVVSIPAGTFTMGSPTDEPNRIVGEIQHSVMLTKGFKLSKYEITTAQYCVFLNAAGVAKADVGSFATHPVVGFAGNQNLFQVNQKGWTPKYNDATSKWESDGNTPMIYVTWFGAKAYADWAGGSLPTEAQWEYACRAGTITAYSFGADVDNLDDYAWYMGNARELNAVGTKKPNAWGLYDMHGNVWEWCADWYVDWYLTHPADPVTDPTGADSGSYRVARGGCWYRSARGCRSAYRYYSSPDDCDDSMGFRVALP